MDPVKRSEWYCHRPQTRNTNVNSTYRTMSGTASSYNSSSRTADNSSGEAGVFHLRSEVDRPAHCREVDQYPGNVGGYRDPALAQERGLYHTEVRTDLWHPGYYGPDPTDSPVPESSGGEESDSDSDVIFLVSSTKDTLLCSSLSRDSVSPIVEPLSPAALSLDEGRGCFLLPQTLSSPSPDSTYSEESSDSSMDIPVRLARPEVLRTDVRTVYRNPVSSTVEISSDDSDVVEVPVTNGTQKSQTCTGTISCKKIEADEVHFQKKEDSPPSRGLRRSARIRNSTSYIHQFIDSVSHHHSTRWTNINKIGLYKEFSDSDDMMDSSEQLSSSENDANTQQPVTKRPSVDSVDSFLDTQRVDKSVSESPPEKLSNGYQSSCQVSRSPNKRKQDNMHPASKSKKERTQQKTHHEIPTKQQSNMSSGHKAAVNKTPATKRKRKKHKQTGPSALFSPMEPEIKLKYASLKEKKDNKPDSFHPFVHIEHRMCTVVNYQEDQARMRCNRGQKPTGTLSGIIPKTSCFQLGRLSSESKCQPLQACCLCGESSNAIGLGDLHGPYFPIGQSYNCQVQNGRTVSPGDKGSEAKREDRLHEHCERNSRETAEESGICLRDCKPAVMPSAKDPLTDGNNRAATVCQHTNERWIHEDCGIWSAGVFLVKGKLYGLDEAVGVAKESVCDACDENGATVGCFQKGCLTNYHYKCAIQSGCALNEENFSVRCPKHKNTPLRSSSRKFRR